MKIAFIQINSTVRDIEGNSKKILSAYNSAIERGTDIAITPELALLGYPPLDLLYRPSFLEQAESAALEIAKHTTNSPLLLGSVTRRSEPTGRPLFNSALLLRNSKIEAAFHKRLLPTYDVFEEDRYFEPGTLPATFILGDKKIGVTICEDVWNDKNFWQHTRYAHDPVSDLTALGCSFILNLSASPWHHGKQHLRADMLSSLAKKTRTPIAFCNLVGGNDELVFDGRSTFINSEGATIATANAFTEDLIIVDSNSPAASHPSIEDEKEMFDALVLGTRDYVHKCGFKKALIGLSGGIDSALTAAIAVHALGADNVTGVAMPSRFSTEHSITDAIQLAKNLHIKIHTLPIEPPFSAVLETLKPVFENQPWDVTEENIQSRLRGLTLMALSNKTGAMVLTTGNKSELAVGYCTIYGDMCGGLAVISDVPKTWVYRISKWLNRHSEIIPHNTIQKPPSAELRPDQKDQDSLPEYDLLDTILELHVEQSLGLRAILEKNIAPEETVRKVLRLVHIAEYKRRQAAPGIKVTPRAFGRGWRMPIAKKSDY